MIFQAAAEDQIADRAKEDQTENILVSEGVAYEMYFCSLPVTSYLLQSSQLWITSGGVADGSLWRAGHW
jgi:hypothetical protein